MIILIKENFYSILFIGIGTGLAQNRIGHFCQYIEILFIPQNSCPTRCGITAHTKCIHIDRRCIRPNCINRTINGWCALDSFCILRLCFQRNNATGWIQFGHNTICQQLCCIFGIIPCVNMVEQIINERTVLLLYPNTAGSLCNKLQINCTAQLSCQRYRNINIFLCTCIFYSGQQLTFLLFCAAVYSNAIYRCVDIVNPYDHTVFVPSSFKGHICWIDIIFTQTLQGLRYLYFQCPFQIGFGTVILIRIHCLNLSHFQISVCHCIECILCLIILVKQQRIATNPACRIRNAPDDHCTQIDTTIFHFLVQIETILIPLCQFPLIGSSI